MSKKDVKIPCAHCGCTDLPLHACSKCKAKQYCGRPCQVADWKGGHKAQCTQGSSTFPMEPAPMGEICPICLEELKDSCLLPCGHKFDVACVEKMRKFGATQVCPCCRAKLPPSAETMFNDAIGRHLTILFSLKFKDMWIGDGVSKEERAMMHDAMTPEQKKEMHRIVRLYKASAEQGLAVAQNNLGVMYRRGIYMDRNVVKAVEWYRKAVAQGFSDAQFNLATMYRYGTGVPTDYAAALDLYKKAAEQGDDDAMFDMGTMYYMGIGVKTDFATALVYFRQAAAIGEVRSIHNIGVMYHNGEGVPVDQGEAIRWVKKAADMGNPQSQLMAGLYYEHGANHAAAFHYYKKAVDNGSTEATVKLAICYVKGMGCPRDDDLAMKYMKLAADSGHFPKIVEMQTNRQLLWFLRNYDRKANANTPTPTMPKTRPA